MLAETAVQAVLGRDEVVLIPVYDLPAAGAGAAREWLPLGEPATRLEAPLKDVQTVLKAPPQALVAVRIAERSMEPVYRKGDLAIIDRSTTEVPEAGGYFLLRTADGWPIKHVQIEGGDLLVSSLDVTQVPRERLTPAEALRIQILGMVVAFQPDPWRAKLTPAP